MDERTAEEHAELLQRLADPAFDPAQLVALSHDISVEILRAVAAHPNTPREALLDLLERWPDDVLSNPAWAFMHLVDPGIYQRLSRSACRAIAGSPHCPVDFVRWAFKHTGSDHERWLFEALVLNAHLSDEVRLKAFFHFPWYALLEHAHMLTPSHHSVLEALPAARHYFQQMFIDGQRWRPDRAELERMISLGPLGGRWVAQYARTPVDLLAPLGRHANRWIRLAIAGHAATPAQVLLALAGDDDHDVRAAACKHPSAPAEILTAHLDTGKCAHWVYPFLTRPDVSVADLRRALDLGDPALKRMCLMHPSMPIEEVIAHAADTDRQVRMGVAAHPAVPAEVLEGLATDDDKFVREEVAKNPNTPERVLVGYAQWAKSTIKGAMAEAPSLPHTVMAMLVVDDSFQVRTRLAENPSMPPQLLDLLSSDDDQRIRVKVARHASTPDEVILRLTSDSEAKVVKQASRTAKKRKLA
ncbi:MAG: hypothetical protein ACE366_18175 [Bradymonadia bacterium]